MILLLDVLLHNDQEIQNMVMRKLDIDKCVGMILEMMITFLSEKNQQRMVAMRDREEKSIHTPTVTACMIIRLPVLQHPTRHHNRGRINTSITNETAYMTGRQPMVLE